MPDRDLPAVRILPMSDKLPGFEGLSIEAVQESLFLRHLVKRRGRFRYPKSGLNAEPGTIILFQFKARVIASAAFVSGEKFDPARATKLGYGGEIIVDPKTIRVFDPVDAEMMKQCWPAFRSFGHVKQRLHPEHYATFAKRLKHVRAPFRSSF